MPPFFYVESPINVVADPDRGGRAAGRRHLQRHPPRRPDPGHRRREGTARPERCGVCQGAPAGVHLSGDGGRSPDAGQIDKVDRIRRQWEPFFLQATDGRMQRRHPAAAVQLPLHSTSAASRDGCASVRYRRISRRPVRRRSLVSMQRGTCPRTAGRAAPASALREAAARGAPALSGSTRARSRYAWSAPAGSPACSSRAPIRRYALVSEGTFVSMSR